MSKIKDIKGLIFDYGGTLDTNGTHWSEVIWKTYQEIGIPVRKEQFREAYVVGERYLANPGIVKSNDVFYDVLLKKSIEQINYLTSKGLLPDSNETKKYPEEIARMCNRYAINVTEKSGKLLKSINNLYPLILVTNFYGNIHSVLENFHLLCYFNRVIESAKVGVRKPNPQIFELGIEALHATPDEVIVVGDSVTNDIIPAKKLGCRTIWLEGIGWEPQKSDVEPDYKVSTLEDIKFLL